jgi:ribonuclease HI
MYFDRSYTLKGAGAGVVLIPPEGNVLKYAVQFEFPATNNIVEYEGLVTGLRLAKDLSIRQLLIRGDSQLVARKVQKEYHCNNDNMVEYLVEVQRMEKFFDGFKVWYIPHLDNHDADHLAWIDSSKAPTLPDVIVVKLSKPSVKPAEPISEADLMVIDRSNQEPVFDWMNPIKMFLSNQPLSDDDAEVERIACKAKMYHLIDEVLYRQGANGMMIRCISREEGIQLL